jgi:hippurate hydrolase
MERLEKNVLLVFQSSEETTGGAKQICDSGVFEKYRTERIYGLHLWPGYPKNTVICRRTEFMASTMVVHVAIEGKSVHLGEYKQGKDALEAACRFVTSAYEMEKNEVAPTVHRLLRFGVLKSGRANNVLADKAYLEGSIRTYSDEVRKYLWDRLQEIAADIGAWTGTKFSFEHSDPYPAVINPSDIFDEARVMLMKSGFDFFEPEAPLMISEDFSWYQRYLPGLFMHLGTGMEERLHSPRYQIDEDVLHTGTRLFKALLGWRE